MFVKWLIQLVERNNQKLTHFLVEFNLIEILFDNWKYKIIRIWFESLSDETMFDELCDVTNNVLWNLLYKFNIVKCFVALKVNFIT